MDIMEYLQSLSPRNLYLVEVLRPEDINFCRIPGMYAVRILREPFAPGNTEGMFDQIIVGDIVMTRDFNCVWTEDQISANMTVLSWENILRHELRNTHDISVGNLSYSMSDVPDTVTRSNVAFNPNSVLMSTKRIFGMISEHSVILKGCNVPLKAI